MLSMRSKKEIMYRWSFVGMIQHQKAFDVNCSSVLMSFLSYLLFVRKNILVTKYEH